jgi:hypothetical protein
MSVQNKKYFPCRFPREKVIFEPNEKQLLVHIPSLRTTEHGGTLSTNSDFLFFPLKYKAAV